MRTAGPLGLPAFIALSFGLVCVISEVATKPPNASPREHPNRGFSPRPDMNKLDTSIERARDRLFAYIREHGKH